jgi:hypothetical protein
VAPLTARSPKLPRALAGAKNAGHAYVVIDGTLIPIVGRLAADLSFCSGKHRHHGMDLQVIASPEGGEILWVSGPLPTPCTT